MTLILELADKKEAALKAKARAQGVSAEQYAAQVLERDLEEEADTAALGEKASGMVEENGLLVYRTGNPLPLEFVNEAIRRGREERSLQVLGNPS